MKTRLFVGEDDDGIADDDVCFCPPLTLITSPETERIMRKDTKLKVKLARFMLQNEDVSVSMFLHKHNFSYCLLGVSNSIETALSSAVSTIYLCVSTPDS